MKVTSALLCAASALALSGCVTAMVPGQGLQTQEAQAARQVIETQCVVGRISAGKPRTIVYIREGVVSLRAAPPPLQFRHSPPADEITIYSVRNVENGWKIFDASTGAVRDNFYLNAQTGAFACSEQEWLAAGGAPRHEDQFQRANVPTLGIGQ